MTRKQDEEELKNIFEVVLPTMVRERDVAGYASLFAKDAIWCPPDAVNRHGQAEIAEGVAQILATDNYDPTFKAREVEVIEPFGYVFGGSREKITPIGGGKTSIARSTELWIFIKEEGVWRIYRMIWNLKPSESTREE